MGVYVFGLIFYFYFFRLCIRESAVSPLKKKKERKQELTFASLFEKPRTLVCLTFQRRYSHDSNSSTLLTRNETTSFFFSVSPGLLFSSAVLVSYSHVHICTVPYGPVRFGVYDDVKRRKIASLGGPC